MATTWTHWTSNWDDGGTSCSSDSTTYVWQIWVTDSGATSGNHASYVFTPSVTDTITFTWHNWNETLGPTYICNGTEWHTWNTNEEIVYEEQVEEFSEGQKERLLEYERKFVEERKEAKRKAEAHEKARKEAEEKAKKLLLDIIGEDELEVYDRTGRVLVKGKKYDYIIRKVGVVQRVEKDKIQDLCVHLENRHAFPETDNVIALILLAKADEYELEKLANKCGRSDRPAQLPECANFK